GAAMPLDSKAQYVPIRWPRHALALEESSRWRLTKLSSGGSKIAFNAQIQCPMQNLRDRPIRKKITITVMMVAVAVLLPVFSVLFGFQVYTLRQHSVHELAVTGEMTAHNCVTAVMFKDEA